MTTMTCEAWCGVKGQHEDAAKRLADTYNLHRMADQYGGLNKWFAASLREGESDGVLYDSKLDCVTHQHHNEKYYTFIKIVPTTMKVCEAQVMLNTARRLYENGMRMTDPDHKHGGPDLITRLTVEDQLWQMRGIVTNLQMPGGH
jgi:hypothetical protein